MVVVTNAKHVFNDAPSGYPEPGKSTITDTSETIDLDNVPLNGGFLIKTLVLSIDPYLRNKMRETSPYTDVFVVGEPLYNFGVGVVLRSEKSGVKVGDHVYGILKFQQYSVEDNQSKLRVLPEDSRIPWSVYVGAAGMPGQTAVFGWKEYSQAKPGEVAFVTTGAGPVGSLVVQLAKQQGLKVIASAGSDAKVQFMKEIGADVAFNYKTTSTREILEKEGPVDIYWDNVGGETLEAALHSAALYSRFIVCGMITSYNQEGKGVQNLNMLYRRNITMHGFGVNRLLPKYEEDFYQTIPRDIADGKIKYSEHLYEGLDAVGQALYDVQTGGNNGKAVIVVAKE